MSEMAVMACLLTWRRGGVRWSVLRATKPTATTKMIVPITLTCTGTPMRFLA